MTGSSKKEQNALCRLADLLVEDIFNMSDAEILQEFKEDGADPDAHAAEMRRIFEKSVIAAKKRRLVAAREGARANQSAQNAKLPISIADARARLRTVLSSSNAPPHLTFAARNERELSDSDIAGMIEDLQELGVNPPKDK